MKVFVAGATGAVGRPLVQALVQSGHEVVAMTRSPEKTAALREGGATPVVADGLDAAAVRRAVEQAMPAVAVHQMSSLTGVTNFKRFDDDFALTNRLRTEGLDYLMAAARAAGVRRVVAQSFGNWNLERTGGPVKTEDDPLDPNPAAAQRRTAAAIRHLEATVTGTPGIQGLALRYGILYGPGTGFAADGELTRMVRARKLPLIGNGAGVWSFIHVDDAAAATAAAVERGAPGIYNVADDEPAPAAVWLPELARILGAKPPRRVPVWVGRLAAGEAGVSAFTQIRGASNAKAKRELGWQPRYPSWREGFRHDLSAGPDRPRAT